MDWREYLRREISYAFLTIRNTADSIITPYTKNSGVHHFENQGTGGVSFCPTPLPPALLQPTSLAEGFMGSIRLCLGEELVKRVSRVSKEYNLLRYCDSIMAYWEVFLCPGQQYAIPMILGASSCWRPATIEARTG